MNLNTGNEPKVPIQLLPIEVWVMILNKLEKEEVSNVRLVCKQWAKDALDYYNYRIFLNEDSSGLEFILQLRIVKLILRKVVGERIQISLNSEHPAPGKLTFKHPDLIRKIISSSLAVTPQCLQDLIKVCEKKLTCFEHDNSPRPPLGRDPNITFPPPREVLPFNLPDLKTCVIRLCSTLWDTVLWSQFVNSSLPKLQKLNIILNKLGPVVTPVSKTLQDIVKLIIKNPDGLKQLQVKFRMNHYERDHDNLSLSPEQLSLSTEELEALKAVRNLQFATIQSHHRLFNDLIGQQKQMTLLVLRMKMESTDLSRYVPFNGFERIAILHVDNLMVSGDYALDLALFKRCRFKELRLARNIGIARAVPSLRPELINLEWLPGTIRRLFVERLDILSRDILLLLSSDLLPILQTLSLASVGCYRDVGVNSEVLERMERFESRTIDEVYLAGAGIHHWYNENDTDNEVEKRKEIILRLGFSAQEEHLLFIRDDNNRLKTGYQ